MGNAIIDLLSRKGTIWSLTLALIALGWSEGVDFRILALVAGVGAVKMITRTVVEWKHGPQH